MHTYISVGAAGFQPAGKVAGSLTVTSPRLGYDYSRFPSPLTTSASPSMDTLRAFASGKCVTTYTLPQWLRHIGPYASPHKFKRNHSLTSQRGTNRVVVIETTGSPWCPQRPPRTLVPRCSVNAGPHTGRPVG